MARFLFSVWPSTGHLYPALAVACELRSQGHAVAFHTIPAHDALLARLGLDVYPIEDVPGITATGVTLRDEPAGAQARKAMFLQRFVAPVPSLMPSLRQAIAAYQPDVLVNDTVSFAPLLVAEQTQHPLATLSIFVATWPGRDLAPFGLGLPLACDAPTRARYAVLRAQGDAVFAEVVAALNALRSSLGLPSRAGPLAAATLSPYLHLVQTAAAFDYGRTDLPPQMHYVGPCVFDPPTAPDAETAAWLATLPPACPLVLVTASSVFRQSTALVEAALAGLRDSDVAVLATLPIDHPMRQTLLPALQRVVDFVPHAQVLPRATVVLTHGGFGTVTKVLCAGRPLVVVPYGGDQPEVAQRVVAAGAGVRLAPHGLTPAAVRDAVQLVLSDPAYALQARVVGQALAQQDGPATATALLTCLAATGQPVCRDDPRD